MNDRAARKVAFDKGQVSRMMQTRAMMVWPWAVWAAANAVLASGCAGGAWLERPLAAEMPVEGPSAAYPTAMRGSAAGPPSGPSAATITAASDNAAVPATTLENSAATSSAPPAITPAPSRLDRHPPLLPALAVIPPQFVHHAAPPALPASPESVAAPPSSSMPASATTALHSSWPATPAAASGEIASFVADRQAPPLTATPPGAVTVLPSDSPAAPNFTPAAANQPVSPSDLAAHLDKARSDLIEALEADIRYRRSDSPNDEELPRLEQQLRLAYLTAGRLDDAVAAVESLDAQQQEAYKNLMFGLGVWISPDEARRPPLRSAKVLHSLRDATSDLAASSKLELRNLVFCERVDYFGWYTEFPRKEFQPKQQVILYAEVENFSAEHKGPAGYETELQGSYEILDASGQIIASRQLQLDKEICKNIRRDYFLAYRIYMPDSIPPGRYRLELTIEDLKARGKYQGRKLGEGMIEFAIR
jgi:hypothetical protein